MRCLYSIYCTAVSLPGRNSCERFLSGFLAAKLAVTSSGLGLTCSSTCTTSRQLSLICEREEEGGKRKEGWTNGELVGESLVSRLLNGPSQVAGGNLGVSTRHRLQDGIVDKDVLVLHVHVWRKVFNCLENKAASSFRLQRKCRKLTIFLLKSIVFPWWVSVASIHLPQSGPASSSGGGSC